MDINTLGSWGYVNAGNHNLSFQIGSTVTSPVEAIFNNTTNNQNGPILMRVDGHSILLKGPRNNEPEEIEKLIEENSELPELIEKQVRLLYGIGPRPYREEFDEKGKLVRRWGKQPEIEEMFDDWELKGMEHSAEDTLLQILRRYYYFEEFYPKFFFSPSRLLTDDVIRTFKLQEPMYGFELVENKRTRLASRQEIDMFQDDYESKDFDMVFVGNWNYGLTRKFKKYKKFSLSKARKYKVAIGHYKNDAVGKIYGVNKFMRGSLEWIKGANSTPKDLNSFFNNFFGAKVHIIIPDAWCESKKKMLQKYCEINADRKKAGKEYLKINGIEIGEKYHEHLFTLYVNTEVKKLIDFMSGADNQGKAYVSYSFRTGNNEEERWRFEDVDLKQKEHVDARLSFHKRAQEVLLASKGVDASISNISKDGIISKSGSDLYYNFIIYLFMNRPIAEGICLKPFNDMIRVNKPHLYKQGWRYGLYVDVPQRQEDTSSKDRLQNQVNNTSQALADVKSEIEQIKNQQQ
ncbi:hypothetical protein [Draconibacterium sp.]|uniref:hypothetical protein n=1 Tax=Draconibacterium sp. TaxID=1965318 RepID=UPI003562C508